MTNTTITPTSDQDLFHNCWRLVNCEACLSTSYSCSWCATSQVCVPNEHFRYPFALLAPIKHEDICPLGWRERWEMRAKPFPCRCSTMTLMSVVIAVLSTLLGVLLIHLAVLLSKFTYRKWKARKEGWWRVSRWWTLRDAVPAWFSRSQKSQSPPDEEQRPLLAPP